MKESRYQVDTFEVVALCSVCSHEMEYTGQMTSDYASETGFIHRCANGHREVLSKLYPNIDYVRRPGVTP